MPQVIQTSKYKYFFLELSVFVLVFWLFVFALKAVNPTSFETSMFFLVVFVLTSLPWMGYMFESIRLWQYHDVIVEMKPVKKLKLSKRYYIAKSQYERTAIIARINSFKHPKDPNKYYLPESVCVPVDGKPVWIIRVCLDKVKGKRVLDKLKARLIVTTIVGSEKWLQS